MTGVRGAFWIASGFTIWGSALVAAYATHAVGCAFDWPAAVLRSALGAILILHLAVVTWLLSRRRPGGDVLVANVARWTLIAALIAIVATFGPGLFLTACV